MSRLSMASQRLGRSNMGNARSPLTVAVHMLGITWDLEGDKQARDGELVDRFKELREAARRYPRTSQSRVPAVLFND